MANVGANTGSSQFFINVVDNNGLDTKHPVFGEVIDGMDVVDAISRVPTDGDPPEGNNKPLDDIVLFKATLID
jgi:peptidylprolyl isomerase